MSTDGKTGRAVLLKGAADIAARGAAVITFPIVAQFAGAEGYGAYAQMNVIVGFLIPIASLGLGSVMVRYFVHLPWSPSVARRALKVGAAVIGAGLVVSGLVALLSPLINEAFLRWPQGTELFRWGSLLIVLGAVEYWLLDLLRARHWLVSFSVFQLSQTALVVAAVAFLLPNGYSIVELVAAMVALKCLSLVIAMLLLFLWASKSDEPAEAVSHVGFGEMLRFGFPLTVAGLGLWMVNLSDRLVIGAFMTPTDLGLYAAIYTFASLLVFASSAVFLPAYPRFMAAVADRDAPRLNAEVRLFHRYTVLAVVPGAVFLGVVMHAALRVLGGDAFDINLLVGVLIVVGLFIDQWNGLAHYVLAAFDRTVFLQNMWLICGGLNIALNIAAVPLFGLSGAAAVTLVSFVVLEVTIFRGASRHVNLRREYRYGTTARAAAAAVAAGATAVLILALMGEDLVGVATASVAFWAVYVCGAFMVRELGRRDLELLMGALGIRSRQIARG